MKKLLAALVITLGTVAAAQTEEPKQEPSTPPTHGVSRVRIYCVGSIAEAPMPRAPMLSGIRPPDDSPRKMIGMPLRVATSFV